MEWVADLDWGDVPSWIGVLLAILVPIVAYFERNRIALFFRRKAREPLPKIPPARFVVLRGKDVEWALLNSGSGKAFNVTISVLDSSAAILSSGFWVDFPGGSYGTFGLRVSHGTRRRPRSIATVLTVEWQDAAGGEHRTELSVPLAGEGARLPGFESLSDGKVKQFLRRVDPEDTE